MLIWKLLLLENSLTCDRRNCKSHVSGTVTSGQRTEQRHFYYELGKYSGVFQSDNRCCCGNADTTKRKNTTLGISLTILQIFTEVQAGSEITSLVTSLGQELAHGLWQLNT